MRLLACVLVVIATLTACDKLETFGSPEPIVPKRDNPSFMMTVEIIPRDKIQNHCAELGVQYDANGCTAYYPDLNKCTIYVSAPKDMADDEAFRIIGHETWHCRFGAYHE